MWPCRRRAPCISDPCRDHLPFLIILRGPEFATGVCRISASFRRQRMQKQPALHWLVGCNQPGHYLKVLARLLLTPCRISSCERLQSQTCVHHRVAVIAAHVTLTHLQEDRLDLRAIGFKVQRRGGAGIRLLVLCWRG